MFCSIWLQPKSSMHPYKCSFLVHLVGGLLMFPSGVIPLPILECHSRWSLWVWLENVCSLALKILRSFVGKLNSTGYSKADVKDLSIHACKQRLWSSKSWVTAHACFPKPSVSFAAPEKYRQEIGLVFSQPSSNYLHQ